MSSPQREISGATGYTYAIVASILIIALDCLWKEPGFPARPLVIAALAVGFAAPNRPWRWGIVIASLLLLETVVRQKLGHEIGHTLMRQEKVAWVVAWFGGPSPFEPDISEAISAYLPAIAGCMVGGWVREWITRYRGQRESIAT